MTPGSRLGPDRDLDIALSAAADTNRVIAAADVKAGLVFAAQGVVLAGTAAGVRAAPPLAGVALMTALIAVALAGLTVLLLAASLWPRTGGTAVWFAFPGLRVGDDPPPRPEAGELADAAWVQAGTLAAIARRKYRWFRAALIVGAAGLLVFMIWIVLVAIG